MENNWSLNPISSDQFILNQTLKTPQDKDAVTKAVYAIRNKIIFN